MAPDALPARGVSELARRVDVSDVEASRADVGGAVVCTAAVLADGTLGIGCNNNFQEGFKRKMGADSLDCRVAVLGGPLYFGMCILYCIKAILRFSYVLIDFVVEICGTS